MPFAALAASMMAVSCGTPAPVTTRVVQMEPGPIPTFSPSMPSEISSFAPSYVATFPATSCISGKRRRIALIASITRSEWPCAVSMASTSAFVFDISTARSRKSPVAPTAAPTRNRPCSSFAARGYSSFFWMSLTVIKPFKLKS